MLYCSIKNLPYTALINHGMEKQILLYVMIFFFKIENLINDYHFRDFHRKMQKNLRYSYEEINQYTMDDSIELLEDFDEYDLKKGPDYQPVTYNMTVDTFKNPRIQKHLKIAFYDCIHHHERIMEIAERFEKLMSFFLLLKLADINTLLTLILFAIVCVFLTKNHCISCSL